MIGQEVIDVAGGIVPRDALPSEEDELVSDISGRIALRQRIAAAAGPVQLAASLGGVESLVVLPLYTSHYKLSAAELARVGVEPGTVRASVGLEHPADLIADLQQALRRSVSATGE